MNDEVVLVVALTDADYYGLLEPTPAPSLAWRSILCSREVDVPLALCWWLVHREA